MVITDKEINEARSIEAQEWLFSLKKMVKECVTEKVASGQRLE